MVSSTPYLIVGPPWWLNYPWRQARCHTRHAPSFASPRVLVQNSTLCVPASCCTVVLLVMLCRVFCLCLGWCSVCVELTSGSDTASAPACQTGGNLSVIDNRYSAIGRFVGNRDTLFSDTITDTNFDLSELQIRYGTLAQILTKNFPARENKRQQCSKCLFADDSTAARSYWC